MRVNQETILVGRKVVLVPYRKQHVPRYHEWMKDPQIQEQTASEPLSLEEEYEMQRSWAEDEDKLTFIILANTTPSDALGEGQEEPSAERMSIDQRLEDCEMVGDVNLFFHPNHDEMEDDDDQATTGISTKNVEPVWDAECEIMIAEPRYRRKGLAREALQLMMHYVTSEPTPAPSPRGIDKGDGGNKLPIPTASWLMCKISLTNQASIRLFEALGFTKQKVSEIWQEVEMRLTHQPVEESDMRTAAAVDTNGNQDGRSDITTGSSGSRSMQNGKRGIFSESLVQVLHWPCEVEAADPPS